MADNKPANPQKTVSRQRITERAAVNTVRAFFEGHSQVYLEVDQANDYGKDAYVDLVKDGEVTGLVISIQVKGGPSYRSGSRYYIPYSPSDRNLWADSSVPVFGVVHDEERSCLHWVNLTSELLDRPHDKYGKVEAERSLNDATWPDFYQYAARAAKLGGRSFLGLHSRDLTQQHSAISDCFAIGRFDPRAFIMLRRSLIYLSPESVEHAIYVLAHCAPFHPDRFWTKDNMVSGQVRTEVLRELNWTPSDAAYLLKFVDEENMFHRGSVGEDIYLLLSIGWDTDVYHLFEMTLDLAVARDDMDIAFKSLVILQYRAGDDAPEVASKMVERYPNLIKDSLIRELLAAVQEYGWVDIA
jgi:hypothetical protein